MSKLVRTLAALLLSCGVVSAAETSPIPADVQRHMEAMVGSWTFSGHQGTRAFSGEEEIGLMDDGAALVQKGFFDLGGGEKEHYAIFSRWDGSKQTVRVHGFTTNGVVWEGAWRTLDGPKWFGTSSGNAATFEVGKDSMRYEDAGDGTPWVTEFRRNKSE